MALPILILKARKLTYRFDAACGYSLTAYEDGLTMSAQYPGTPVGPFGPRNPVKIQRK